MPVYYKSFTVVKIDVDGNRVILPGETIDVDNITASSSLGTLQSDNDGNIAGGTFAAAAGDVIEFSSGSYPEVMRYTLTATELEAYTNPDNATAAFVVEDLSTRAFADTIDYYVKDLDNPDVKPRLIGSGRSTTNAKIAYQTSVAKNLRIVPVSKDINNKVSTADLDIATGYFDIAIPGSSGLDLNWLNVKDYGAIGDGVTDDSDAIQDAIDAAVLLGCVTIYFPRGTYFVDGSLQGTLHKSVLRIPVLNGDTDWASIEFRGCAPPALPGFGSVSLGTDDMPTQGSIILSTGDDGAVFGAEPGLVGGAAFNASRVIFRNLTIRTKDNPTRGGIDAYYNLQLEVDNVMVDTGKYGSATTEPSTPGVTGITFPRSFNATSCVARVACVSGYYDGWLFSELATGDDLIAYHCKRAWVFAAGNLSHALRFGRIVDSACEIGIACDAQTHLVIDEYDAERAVTGWYTRLYDLDCSAAIVMGSMKYHITTAGTGAANTSLLLDAWSATSYFAVNQIGNRNQGQWDCSGTSQSLSNGGYAPVEWTMQEDADDAFTWSAVTDPEKIIIKNAGRYCISASVAFETNTSGHRELFLNRGATTILAGSHVTPVAGEETIAHISATLWLDQTDELTILARQTSGGSLLVKNLGGGSFASKLMISKVG